MPSPPPGGTHVPRSFLRRARQRLGPDPARAAGRFARHDARDGAGRTRHRERSEFRSHDSPRPRLAGLPDPDPRGRRGPRGLQGGLPDGHPDPRHGRLQLPGERELVGRLVQRCEVRLHQGDRGHLVHQPLLHPAVQRLLQRRHDPRLLPLRPARRLQRRRAGRLLRGPRRRLVGRRQDAAGRPGHGVQPLRRNVLRQVRERHGQLDLVVLERIPRQDRPLPDHLHLHELVEHLHGQQQRLQHQQRALGRPLLHLRRHPAGRMGLLHLLAVGRLGHLPR
ncbi:hypothetical protein SBRY_10826 [Actinacidiphila bryophytorum]|uniref:Uncharacterized protein n=1 Tax=Actinacidiphila bryophytorum TaxID=1436133 RepID=A0A9W4E6I1_9ACTN|nr:hypothetical protein SBRY_10826 [Actinacidiphila bryophytorum]